MEFIAQKIEQMLAEQMSMRDDMRVLTAIVLRLDGTLSATLNEMRETHRQIARMHDRVRKLEDAP